MNLRELAYVTGGALVGFGVSYISLEARFRKGYEESVTSLKSALYQAEAIQRDRLNASEILDQVAKGDVTVEMVDDDVVVTGFQDVLGLDFNEIASASLGKVKSVREIDDGIEAEIILNETGVNVLRLSDEPVKNDYHKAISATETPVEVFVDGGVNDYGMSYIEEEEFFEDDGRVKNQIVIHMDEHNPIFLMEGVPIDDWDQRIGDSILVDFYKLVPPGLERILYVRNHRTNEDYEVIQEQP